MFFFQISDKIEVYYRFLLFSTSDQLERQNSLGDIRSLVEMYLEFKD